MDTDKATAIREARAQLRARGEVDSLNRVVAIVHSSKRTVQKYWAETTPVEATPVPPAPEPVPTTEAMAAPEPEPELPAFTLENLRAYYLNRFESPWPQGVTPPVEAYPVLQALWKEANEEIGTADRHRYVVMNALAHLRDIDAHPEMRAVNTRRGTARLIIHSVQTDMDTVRQRAHREGIELKDPRLS